MGPIVEKLSKAYEGKSIQFVKFDFTSAETTKAAAAKAEELGVSELYKGFEKKTGFVLLYNARTKKLVARLTRRDDEKAWTKAIDKALGDS
jgi:hypothetical protein